MWLHINPRCQYDHKVLQQPVLRLQKISGADGSTADRVGSMYRAQLAKGSSNALYYDAAFWSVPGHGGNLAVNLPFNNSTVKGE